jgi:hypothetical protein
MKNIVLLFVAFSFFITSCGKLVTDSHPDFVGTWISTDFSNTYVLVIGADNSARFDRMDLNGDTITTNLGTARVKSNDKLVIGNLKLNISKYPTFDSQTGDWTCELENWPFVRQ